MDDGSMSVFNEAALKMHRIHRIQDNVNMYKISSTNFNPEFGKYNYEIIFSLLTSLEMEVIGKLTKDESENVDDLRNTIEKNLEENPPHQSRRDYDKKRIVFIKEAWEILRKNMFNYERELRKMIDKHNLGAPSEIEAGGWD